MCIFQHIAYTVLYNPHAMHIFLCVVVRNICPCCSFIVVQSLSSKTFCTQQAWWAILANWGDEADQNLALHKWQAMQTRNCATKGTKLSGRILKLQPDKNCVAEDGSTPLVIYTLSHKYTDCGLATVLPSGKPLHRQSWGSSFLENAHPGWLGDTSHSLPPRCKLKRRSAIEMQTNWIRMVERTQGASHRGVLESRSGMRFLVWEMHCLWMLRISHPWIA